MLTMEKMLKLSVCILGCLALLVQANNNSFINYADVIKLNYTDGIWQCDMITCPNNTYGCKIVYENSPQYHNVIFRRNICYMEDGWAPCSLVQADDMPYDQTININITSYLGAPNAYGAGFGLHVQTIQGTVAPNGWPGVQETMNDIINSLNITNITDN